VVELGAEAIWTLNVDLESQPGKRKRTANLKAGSCSSLDGYESLRTCAQWVGLEMKWWVQWCDDVGSLRMLQTE